MNRIVSLACALALCLTAAQAPAKEGCGAGLHMNKKGQCVVNKKGHGGGHGGKACPAHYRKSHGQCIPK
jgi:hypothetical protein